MPKRSTFKLSGKRGGGRGLFTKHHSAHLSHVDYNCGGKCVLRSSVLVCVKCKQTSAFGPMTVITGVV